MLMKPLPPLKVSVSARWALRLALFAPVLGVLSILAHRGGWVSTPEFLILLRVVAGISFVALFLCAAAIRSLWVKGTKGGRQASWAIVITVMVLGPYIWSLAMAFTHPDQSDVSTDIANPPLFAADLTAVTGDAAGVVAGGLKDGYADLIGRRYNADQETVLNAVAALAARGAAGQPVQRGRIGADEALYVEYRVESLILKLPAIVVVRVRDEGETTFVDIRSRSLYGDNDRGFNAALIERFLDDLDNQLIGTASL